jgi:hypothetical protein
MNWQEAINNLNMSPENVWEGSINDFCNVLDISHYGWSDEFGERVKKIWIKKWLCTDTHVGLAVYQLDGETIAVSAQPARKSPEEINFISLAAAEKVRTAILDILKRDDTYDPAPIVDLTEEIDNSWFRDNS